MYSFRVAKMTSNRSVPAGIVDNGGHAIPRRVEVSRQRTVPLYTAEQVMELVVNNMVRSTRNIELVYRNNAPKYKQSLADYLNNELFDLKFDVLVPITTPSFVTIVIDHHTHIYAGPECLVESITVRATDDVKFQHMEASRVARNYAEKNRNASPEKIEVVYKNAFPMTAGEKLKGHLDAAVVRGDLVKLTDEQISRLQSMTC